MRLLHLSCHPADAMSLAVRAGVTIVATQEALAHGRPVEADPEPQAAAEPASTLGEPPLEDWLRKVRPADFRGENERA